jgi:predicted nucleic acid-binding protein
MWMGLSKPIRSSEKRVMSNAFAVIDASLVMKALLPNPETTHCQAVLAHLQDTQLAVPALWVYEVTSTLAKAVHFKHITVEESKTALHQALELDVQIIAPDETQSNLALEWTLRLKRASAYDSFYLAIAEALEVPFWTADQRLVNAFQDLKPTWLHWIGEMA